MNKWNLGFWDSGKGDELLKTSPAPSAMVMSWFEIVHILFGILLLVYTKPEVTELVDNLDLYYRGPAWRKALFTAKQWIFGQHGLMVDDFIVLRIARSDSELFFVGISGTWISSDYFSSQFSLLLGLLLIAGVATEGPIGFLNSLPLQFFSIISYLVFSSRIHLLEAPSTSFQAFAAYFIIAIVFSKLLAWILGSWYDRRWSWACLLRMLSAMTVVHFASLAQHLRWGEYSLQSSQLVLSLLIVQAFQVDVCGLASSLAVLAVSSITR